MFRLIAAGSAIALLTVQLAAAQDKDDIKELKLRDWHPRSMLITKTTEVPKPAFPVIDVHNHLGGGKATAHARAGQALPRRDGRGRRPHGGQPRRRLGRRLKETLAALDEAHPGRFLTYALIDFAGIDDPGWSDREAARLRRELRGRRQGPEVPQDARPRRPLQGRPVRAGRRPQARPDLGSLRPLQAAGRDPHRRPRRLLHPARTATASAGTS